MGLALYNQILLLSLECVIVAVLLLALFRLRVIFGLSLLLITLGVFQFLQVFLSNTLFVSTDKFPVLSGSMVFFSASLFSVLLVYICEDALETRKIIYALLGANLILALLLLVFSFNLNLVGIVNYYHLSKSFFVENARIITIGALVLTVDALVLIPLYELISKITKFLFFRIFVTMLIVLAIDSFLFSFGAFYKTPSFTDILQGNLLSKSYSALIYSLFFWFYLTFFDKESKVSEKHTSKYKDLFNKLTFRQKFEELSKEKETVETELQTTKEYLQTIFNSTTDALFVHDADTGNILDVNKTMCQMFGYEKKEVLQKTMKYFSAGTAPYTETDANNLVRKAIKEGLQNFEWLSKHKNGQLFWTDVSLHAVTFSKKKYVLATVKNIDERKKLELAKKEAEERFQKAFIANPDAININRLDDGLYIDVNEGFSKITGYSKQEVLGKTSLELNIWAHTEDRKKLLETLQKHNKVVNFEATFVKKDGSLINGLMSASVIRLNNIDCIVSVSKDITEVKYLHKTIELKNNLIENLVNTIPDLVWLKDAAGIYLKCNKRFEKLYGAKETSIIGKTDYDFVDKETADFFRKNDLNAITAKKTVGNEEFLKFAEGNYQGWFETLKTPMFTSNGNIIGVLGIARDITERKLFKEKLKTEKDIAQLYLDIAGVMMLILNKHGNVELINPKGCELLGYTKEEMIGLNWFNHFIPKSIRITVKDLFLKIIEEKLNLAPYYENEILTKSGETKLIAWQNVIIKDEQGNITGVLSSGEDITERKKNEKIIFEREQQLSTIFDTAGDIIFYVAVEAENRFRFTTVNNSFLAATGLPKQAIEGKYVSEVIPEPSLSLVLKKYKEAIEKKITIRWEETTNYPSGTKTGIVSITPIFNNENCTHLVGTVHDITERVETEKELKISNNEILAINNIIVSISSIFNLKEMLDKFLDEVLKIVDLEGGAICLTEPDNSLKIIAHKATSDTLISDFTKTPVKIDECLCGKCALDQQPLILWSKENVLKVASREILLYENIEFYAAFPFIIKEKCIGILSIFTRTNKKPTQRNLNLINTLTKQVAIAIKNNQLYETIKNNVNDLELKIKDRTKELEQTNKELNDFSQIVSHDLKAPLRAISQISYWLSQDYAKQLDETGQNYLQLIIARVKRLNDLIEGILQYSHSSRPHEKEKVVNLNTVVKDVITMLNVPNNISITIENTLPTYVGDQTRLEQLFQNLVNNALKFNDKPKGWVKIGCSLEGDFYKFYVSDNGIGIKEKYFNRIFIIFQRLKSRDEQEGTGIGLTLVKRIVQLYGGEIWLTSKLGEGTTFYFTLPKQHKLLN